MHSCKYALKIMLWKLCFEKTLKKNSIEEDGKVSQMHNWLKHFDNTHFKIQIWK